MEYKGLKFNDTDLRGDITSRLEKELKVEISLMCMPNLTQNEINEYIGQAIEQIKKEGNSALYWGLVSRGTQIALDKIRESR